jgi:hypothetical protein
MKIVKRGDITRVETWVGTCSECGTEMEARKQELYLYVRESAQGQRQLVGEHKCPLCEAVTLFEKAHHFYLPRPEVS